MGSGAQTQVVKLTRQVLQVTKPLHTTLYLVFEKQLGVTVKRDKKKL